MSDPPFFNEACANCGVPADLHKGPGDEPSGTPHTVWGDVDSCRTFVRCDPPRAAYGYLPGVDHRELLRKYVRHTFTSEPDAYVTIESAAAFIAEWLEHSPDFTAEEKAEVVRLASEEAG